MKVKTTRLILLLCMVAPLINGHSQTQLDNYIREGLTNNTVLQQKQIGIEKALLALQIARGNFLPSVQLNGTFSTAKGGRYAELPIGDLMNPVYSTLNQLTGSSSFPQIENQQINFLPSNYYDVYVRTAVPVINTDIIYSSRIREQQQTVAQLDVNCYARQLVNDIKVAYFNYLSAREAVQIYEKALATLDKNIAFHEALIRNGKGLNAQLLRAKSEWEATHAQLVQARNQVTNAQYYFNFLLNKELNSPITTEEVTLSENISAADVAQREELKMVEQATIIQQTVLRMNEHYWVPKLNAFLDLGSQGVDWEVSSKSAYYMVGLSLTVPIFNGNKNTRQVKMAEWNLRESEINLQQTRNQLSLAVQIAMNQLSSASANYNSALKQQEAADAYFLLIEKALQEGAASEIEFIDASNQRTQAELQVSLLQQQVNTAIANLERETASYPIPLTPKTNE